MNKQYTRKIQRKRNITGSGIFDSVKNFGNSVTSSVSKVGNKIGNIGSKQ